MFDKKQYNREYAARKRVESKLNGLCPICGKPVEDAYINCSECRKKIAEKAKERRLKGYDDTTRRVKSKREMRYKFREEGRCTECGKIDSYTIAGRAYCFECNEKRNLRRREQYKKNKEAFLIPTKARRTRLKEEGLCTDCGKRKAEKGNTRCSVCLAKRRNYQSKKNRESSSMRGLDGLCTTCRKNPPKEGFKICESCYENLRKAGEKGAQRNHEIFVEGKRLDPNFKLPFQKTYSWIFADSKLRRV